MSEGSNLTALRDIPRQFDLDRKTKIDVTKTEFPLIRSVAVGEMGWKIWGK